MDEQVDRFSYDEYLKRIFCSDPRTSFTAQGYVEHFIPKKLYKYAVLPSACDIERPKRLNCIANEEIWLSSRHVLNDPLEFQYAVNSAINSLDILQRDYVTAMINSHVVYCLADSLKNYLLWAHYANGHRGYCIEYMVKGDPNQIFPVEYLRNYPDYLTLIQNIYSKSTSKTLSHRNKKDLQYAYALNVLFGYKGDVWQYENEYRVITSNPDLYGGMRALGSEYGLIISRIICGSECCSLDQRDLKDVCEAINVKRLRLQTDKPEVQLVKMRFEDNFQLKDDIIL